ncbi:polyketide synthase [Actinokineospora diospyrosa]|uniref:Amino acid adenylation domain-containing protein n=1 Tax=Actinokineospora diospyrosa TaxID=103728 RepID=A0ABT1ICV2_9PSEU|nr:polyketide synthase [Actinokineospora diospyrosa]MCP2270181.1 amino acid adenylation domain-containing protein [Actinokineospora diospyrosa]
MTDSVDCVVLGGTRVALRVTARLVEAGVLVRAVLTDDPVFAAWLAERDIPVLAPTADLTALLAGNPVDYLVSVINFRLLTAAELALPRVAAINFHDGPLPRYGGSNVAAWAIYEGAARHAATWHAMVPAVDAGPVLAERWFPVREHSTALSLTYEAAEVGIALFEDLVPHLAAGTLPEPVDTSDRERRFYRRADRVPGLIHAGTDAIEAERISKAMDFGSFPNPLGIPAVVTPLGAVFIQQVRRIPREGTTTGLVAAASTESALKLAAPTADLVISDLTAVDGTALTGRAAAQRLGITLGAAVPAADPELLASIADALAPLRRHEPWWRERLAHLRPAPVPAKDFSAATAHYHRCELAYVPTDQDETRAFIGTFLAVLAEHMGEPRFDFSWTTSTLLSRSDATLGLASPRVPVGYDAEAPEDLPARFGEAAGKLGYATDLELRLGLLRRTHGADGPTFTRIVVLEREDDEEASVDADTEFALLCRAGLPPTLFVRETAMAQDAVFDLVDRIEDLALSDLVHGTAPTTTHVVELPEPEPIAQPAEIAAEEPRVPATVLDLIAAAAAAQPDAVAVQTSRGDLTYAQLVSWSDSIATRLYDEGIDGDSVVGVLTERGPELLPAMLGVLKVGAAMLPMDPGFPAERLARYAAVAGCDLVLTDSYTRTAAEPLGAAEIGVDDGSALAIPPAVGGDDLAYVLFTSGSTGEPKGVEIQHAALANFLVGMAQRLGITEDDRVLAHTTTAFDISLMELLLPLTTGATVVLASRTEAADPARLVELVSRATIAQATPSLWRLLLDLDWTPHAGLTVCSGGEALPPALARRLATGAALWNLYGPTEATIWVTAHRVETVGSFLPLGTPLPGVGLHVLDHDGHPCVEGELHLSGAQLARGYRNRPDRTAEAFVTRGGQRLYRTGDLVRAHDKGTIEWLGRIDGQVKVRGNRVETGEVESVLAEVPGVAAAAVVAVPFEGNGEPRLTAYLVGDRVPGKVELDAFVAARLPEYMVPGSYLVLAALPLTDNGKVARKLLPVPTRDTVLRTEPVAIPQQAAIPEQAAVPVQVPVRATVPVPAAPPVAESSTVDLPAVVAEVFAQVLGHREFGVHDNFFDLGGDSASAPVAAIALGKRLGIDITPPALFATGTPTKLADLLGGSSTAPEPAAPKPTAPEPEPVATATPEPVVAVCATEVIAPVRPDPRDQDLAIIGMACRFPGAATPDEFWSNLAAGLSSVGAAPEGHRGWAHLWTDEDEVPTGWLERVEWFDPARFGLTTREARRLDPAQRLLLSVTAEALEGAGHDARSLGAGTGVFVGTISSDFPELVAGSIGSADPHVATGTALSMLANRLSHVFGWSGTSVAVDTACSSSLVALHMAALHLRTGELDAAVVGAANLVLTPTKTRSFARNGMLSPTGQCRAFDEAADGYVRGEGAGVLVLKRLSDAIAANDPVLAVVRGTAVNHVGGGGFLTAPSATAQEAVIRRAHTVAGIDGSGIGYVEAHGTGTRLGDQIELEALRSALAGAAPGSVPVGSVKTNVGHLEPAAGVAGLIKAVLAVQAGQVPPSANLSAPTSAFAFEDSPLFVPDRLVPWTGPRVAGVSSFGFGGSNAHAVLAAAPDRPIADSPGPHLVVLSAASAPALRTLADRLVRMLRAPYCPPLAALASASRERVPLAHRLACVVDSAEQLEDKLMLFLADVVGARLHLGVAGDGRPSLAEPAGDRKALERAASGFAAGGDLPVRPRGAAVRFPTAPHEEQHLWLEPRVVEPQQPVERTRTWPDLAEAVEHVVRGIPTLPGAAYPGKVAELVGRTRFGLRDLTLRDSVRSPGSLTGRIDGDAVVFRDSAGTTVCDARVEEPSAEVPTIPELPAASVDLARFYRDFAEAGLAYGPGYRCVTALSAGDGFATGTIHVDAANGIVDARLLDGAFQVALAACGAQGLHVPFALQRLSVLGPVPATARVQAVRDREGSGLLTASLVIFDGATPVLIARGVTWKRVEAPTPIQPAPVVAVQPPVAPVVRVGGALAAAVTQWVAAALETDAAALERDRPLEEQGLDSMVAVSLAQDLRARLGVDIPVTLVLEVGTVDALVAELREGYGVTAVPDVAAAPAGIPAMNGAGQDPSVAEVAQPSTSAVDRPLGTPAFTNPASAAPEHPEITGTDIAVIGFDGVFPNAADPQELWRVLTGGEDCLTEVPRSRWDLDAYYAEDSGPGTVYLRRAGFVDELTGFDAGFFRIAPAEARWIDPQQRHLLRVVWRAMEDAGISGRSGRSVGMFVGASYQHYRDQVVGDVVQTAAGLGNHNAILANRVSHFLDLTGPSMTIDTLCSSSLVALHTAVRSLHDGECEQAVVAGVHLALSPHYFQLGSRLRSFSRTGASRAFDAGADGFAPGEGVVAVVLKPLAAALRDGDRVRGVIKGTSVNHGGRTSGLTVPSSAAQHDVISAALARAGVNPETIGMLEAHGTGTGLGDPIEVEGLTKAWRKHTDRTQYCAIGSLKSNIGHLEPAAGLAGLVKVLLAMEHGQIPPTLHVDRPNDHIRFEDTPFYIADRLHEWTSDTLRRAAVSAFGMGGVNAHVVLEEPPPQAAREVSTQDTTLVRVSGATENAVRALASHYADHLDRYPGTELVDFAHTANAGRAEHRFRAAVLAGDRADLATQLRAVGGGDRPVVRSSAKAPVAFLFTGQGSQYPGMARGLYDSEPVFRAALDECADLAMLLLGKDLRHLVFAAPEEELTRTEHAQVAIVAVQAALVRLLAGWGVVPDVVAGHSVGELAAAHAAGVLTLADLIELAVRRGAAMAAQPVGGAMAVVHADASVVLTELVEHPEVELAALNSPTNTTVSGPRPALERYLAATAHRHTALTVSHAFHSAMMSGAVPVFADAVRSTRFADATVPFVSTRTGTWHTGESLRDPAGWAAAIREPVRFTDAVTAVHEAGARVFVEVGPEQVLLPLARAVLPEGAGRFLPTLRKRVANQTSLLTTLAELYRDEGVAVDWTAVHAGRGGRTTTIPAYPFELSQLAAPAVQESVATGAVRPAPAHPLFDNHYERSSEDQ